MDCGSCGQPVKPASGGQICVNFMPDENGNPSQEMCRALLPGVTLDNNRWEIEKCIGRGGHGRTYLALSKRLTVGKYVVKELINPTEDPVCTVKQQNEYASNEARFLREADLLQKLGHPRIPRIQDQFQGAAPPRHYIVMEFINGKSLSQEMQNHANGVDEDLAIKWTLQILEVLEFIHGQTPPICHRDLSPDNVMMRSGTGELVVIDFGIARMPTTATNKTDKLGKVEYAAPEMYDGNIETRSDLFALGAMLYVFLTGRIPDGVDVKTKQTNMRPIKQLKPGIGDELAQVVDRATQFDAAHRYNSAAEMRADLEAVQTGTPVISSPKIAVSSQAVPGKAVVGVPTVNIGKATPQASQFPTWVYPPEYGGLVMVYVPPGAFSMGSDLPELQNWFVRFPSVFREDLLTEFPRRTELIGGNGFWISQSLITNSQYQKFLYTNSQIPAPASESNRLVVANVFSSSSGGTEDRYDWNTTLRTPPRGMENHPVVNVTWQEAAAYAQWINGRLPSEREWERAARGVDARSFPWGNDEAPDKCHWRRNSSTGTIAVGQYPAGISPVGCYDMAGNVRQWTSDAWIPYASNYYPHPTQDGLRVTTRGSSWQEQILPRLRCAFRTYADPGQRSAVIGFRVIRDAV